MIPEELKFRGARVKLAEMCGVKSQSVSQWKKIPPHHVLRVEAAFGVSRHVLRPDIFGPGPDGAASSGPRVERAVMPVAYERAVKSPQVRSRGPAPKPPRGLARAEAQEGREA